MTEKMKLSDWFGTNLAELLAEKIVLVHPEFDTQGFVTFVEKSYEDKTLTERVTLIAEALHHFLPPEYPCAIEILLKIMGAENPYETGMFTHFYWLMPVGKFIELYGLEYFDLSIRAIAELTKRNTGEYAVRPFIRTYPEKMLRVMKEWAKSENFHLRRLASEGLRPKLPWASKLELFVEDPEPVFEILELLKYDEKKFVMRSVANTITDYLKLNPVSALSLLEIWKQDTSESVGWIIKHATRKYRPKATTMNE